MNYNYYKTTSTVYEFVVFIKFIFCFCVRARKREREEKKKQQKITIQGHLGLTTTSNNKNDLKILNEYY